MIRSYYTKTRDKVEGMKHVSETVWHDWPVVALGLIIRAREDIADYPELERLRDRESKRLYREYLRRRWQDGRPEARRWFHHQLDDLEAQLSRRRRHLYSEELARAAEANKDKPDILFVMQDRREEDGD